MFRAEQVQSPCSIQGVGAVSNMKGQDTAMRSILAAVAVPCRGRREQLKKYPRLLAVARRPHHDEVYEF
eukprot:360920-Pleurochrysis_carterae.AAC.1